MKFLSRKFLVAISTILTSALAGDPSDPLQLGVMALVSIAYLIAEAHVDRSSLDSALDAGKQALERVRRSPTEPMLVLLLVAPLLGACGGGNFGPVRATTVAGVLAVSAVDPVISDAYDDVQRGLAEGELDEAAGAERLSLLDRVSRGLDGFVHALTAVHVSLTDSSGDGCVARAIIERAEAAAREVTAALEAARLDVPGELLVAVNFGSAVAAELLCDGGGGA